MKRIIAVLLALTALVFTACAPKNNADCNQNSETSHGVSESLLRGKSLDEIGLVLKTDDIRADDPNLETERETQLVAMTGGPGKTIRNYNSLNGEYTYLCVSTVSPSLIDEELVPIAILQGFQKSDIKDYSYISVGGKNFAPSDLEGCLFFENDEYLVYDFREMMSGKNISDYLFEFGGDTERYSWIEALYNSVYEKKQSGELF